MEKFQKLFIKPRQFLITEKSVLARRKIYNSLWAIFLGIVISGIVILMLGQNPFLTFLSFFKGSFHELNIRSFWINFAIFAISAIAVGIGFKVGLFNIGVAGQMMFGGMLSIYFILSMDVNAGAWVYLVSILIAVVAATSLALIAAILKSFLNVHEVVTTILMNWIVVYIGKYLYNRSSPFANEQANASITINNSDGVFSAANFWIIGIVITLILAIVLWLILQKTTLGYKIKMTGFNKNASKYAGVNEKVTILATLAFSGFLAGLAGWIYYIVLNQNYEVKAYPILIGFDGIAISLLAYNSPIGILFTSFFYSTLETGSAFTSISTSLTKDAMTIIPSIILYLAALSSLFMKFKLSSLIRKYLFLIFQKIYWTNFSQMYHKKYLLWKTYLENKHQHKLTIRKNHQAIQITKQALKNNFDFVLLEKMTDAEKLNYYEKVQKSKLEANKKLKDLGYFEFKDLKNKFKLTLHNQKKSYKEFCNNLFQSNKNTHNEWFYWPILKLKNKFLKKKAVDQ